MESELQYLESSSKTHPKYKQQAVEAQRDGETALQETEYITGWRLHLITLGLCIILFMAQLDSSIVSTAIVAITNDLGGFVKSPWVFTSYLLTYSGLLIIWAKLSDIYGRKPLLIAAILIFTIFSGACGASQTIIQLIMCRWVQGIGGCGIYSLSSVYFFELVPPRKYPEYTALTAAAVTFSTVLGPLIGGAVSNDGTSTWRWIFLMNLPIGILSLVILIFTMPAKLAKEPSAQHSMTSIEGTFSLRSLRRVDILGSLLLLGACLLLATGLQQAAQGIAFSAISVFVLFIFSGLFWIGFVVWQWFVTTKRTVPEPVFPWRFFQRFTTMGLILNSYFSGTILTVAIVQIPQRLITVNGLSPLAAGVRLLPLGICMPLGTITASILMGRLKVPPNYMLIAGGILQLLGSIFLSMQSTSSHIPSSLYGLQVILGIGIGFYNGTLLLTIPSTVEKRDLATGNGAIAQFRVLGAVVGVAIVTSAQTRSLRNHLLRLLPVAQVSALLETTDLLNTLPSATQAAVRTAFGNSYNIEMKIMIGFAAAEVVVSLLLLTRKPIKLSV